MTVAVVVLSLLLGGLVVTVVATLRRSRRAHRLACGMLEDFGQDQASSRSLDKCLSKIRSTLGELSDENVNGEVVRQRLEGILSRMLQGVAICDSTGEVTFRKYQKVLLSSHHSQALVDAAVKRVLESARGALAGSAAALALGNGAVATEDLRLYGPPERLLRISSFALESGAAALIEDCTEQDRIETMRRDFVGNISHELRTPVGAISLLAETIAEEDDRHTLGVLSQRMISEVERINRVIEELTELARVEHDPVGDRSVLLLNEVVLEVTERLSRAAEQHHISLNVSASSEPVLVHADRRQIASVIHNLVDNALKYSKGGSEVNIQVRQSEGMAELVVQDKGIGIPRRDQARIFERFYRVDKSRNFASGGIGLGLAIVRHVAVNHDGKVSVDSLEGEGSTFTFRLPLLAEASSGEEDESRPEERITVAGISEIVESP